MGPSTIYDQVFQESGGMMGAEAVAHTPRNISQIKNVRTKLRRKCNDDDEFSSLLTFTKEKGQSCLRDLQWTPAPRIVYAEDWQMVEIVQNCCQVNSASVLSIDTTFNVGKFYVTSTTYQNRNFINQRTGKCSNLPGPALFHVRQDESQFFYFSYTLLEVNYEFEKVRFIGGDRDKAQKGFLKPLKGVTYLPCKKHLQENMKAKMQSLQLSGTEKNTIMEHVFGNELAQRKGLVDCDSAEEFEGMMAEVSGMWNEDFASYFKEYVADDLKKGMAPKTRRAIGLKDDFFYNNAAECHNFRYKIKVKEDQAANATAGVPKKLCTWVEAISSYKRIVEECRNNIQRAFIAQGPFRLAPEWKHLEISDAEWVLKTPEQRRRYMSEIDAFAKQNAAAFTPPSLGVSANCVACDDESTKQDDVILVEESHGVPGNDLDLVNSFCGFEESGLPTHLKGSWCNAKKIVDLGGVGNFPSNEEKRTVISLTQGICHTVTCGGRERKPLSCDDQCEGFRLRGICAHTIAVAWYNNCLDSYLSLYRPRLSRMVTNSIPTATGKKEHQKRPRKRRDNELRDASDYSPLVSDTSVTSGQSGQTDDLEVVFIRDTAACKCYGCSVAIRVRPSEDPPPAPYDIFLRRKEYRVYRQRASTKMCIAKSKEFVYYHPLKACVPKEIKRDNLLISLRTRGLLLDSHRELLWREFGLSL
ncbi:hypothetical protein P5673_023542 [Acropora cervicornis]|uniref:SWIM-type domain-containing protein n=1 Tax=Acropora cervicornis TaxID=6130 RepID=A0AAD9Q568_ACRCE|nr:hypothetical protein P5673_023542 [Acropora cervicornis]